MIRLHAEKLGVSELNSISDNDSVQSEVLIALPSIVMRLIKLLTAANEF